MADGMRIEMDSAAVVAALLRLGPAAEPYIDQAAKETSDAIVAEARSRLQRQLGASATEATLAGIEITRADRGGFLVGSSGTTRARNLPLWIEKGTQQGKPRSHTQPARPYFYASAELEEGPHFERVVRALERALDELGMGE